MAARQHNPLLHQNLSERRAGDRLIGLGCLVVEMADETLAAHDLEMSRALVELAMSVLHTAMTIAPGIESEAREAHRRLNALTAMVRQASPPETDDPDSQWPYRVV